MLPHALLLLALWPLPLEAKQLRAHRNSGAHGKAINLIAAEAAMAALETDTAPRAPGSQGPMPVLPALPPLLATSQSLPPPPMPPSPLDVLRAAGAARSGATAVVLQMQAMPGQQEAAPPPPQRPPSPLDALRAAAAARSGLQLPASTGDWRLQMLHPSQQQSGQAPLVPANLANMAAQLAWAHLFSGTAPAAAGAAPLNVQAAMNNPAAWTPQATTLWPFFMTTTVAPPEATLPGPRLGPPLPPPCPVAPPSVSETDVRKKLAPFRPPGAADGSFQGRQSYEDEDKNATIWPMQDGGWGFQYPDMYARVHPGGQVEVSWANGKYSVAMEDDRVGYHSQDTVVHSDVYGSLIYHQPSGTMHQRGDEVIYHWCTPNVIIYTTPSGVVYYDEQGMTFRGPGDLAHYAANGDMLYQGEGGITYQRHTGELTHWTEAGAIYRHLNGSLSYTAAGESQPQPLQQSALGPDPFPGPPLSVQQVVDMVANMLTTTTTTIPWATSAPLMAAPAPAAASTTVAWRIPQTTLMAAVAPR